jgi:hypothetical protein
MHEADIEEDPVQQRTGGKGGMSNVGRLIAPMARRLKQGEFEENDQQANGEGIFLMIFRRVPSYLQTTVDSNMVSLN